MIRRTAAALALALLLPAAAAEAVIPSAVGPIQALIVVLPQILLALGAAMFALFKPRTYKLLFAYLWTHKALSAVLLGTIALFIFWPSSKGTAAAEQTGAPWPAFRGGPGRTGAVEGAKGPVKQPQVAWKLPLGATSAVDSSPAVVGNRVYVGISNQSAFGGSSGAIAAVDAQTGAIAWQYEGKGDLSPALRPVFSSPAVWVESGAARYVVSGEGYHDDKNCRIVCLDLKGGAPKLAWSVQTTSHVESAPCIHDGRVYIGAGDDGLWCVELATGKVLWRIEGTPFYEVTGGQLDALEGKTVVATGTVTRVGLGAKGRDDAGALTIDVKTFREHSGPPVTAIDSGRTFERTVTGRVARKEGKVRLEIETWFPDCESPPIGAGDRIVFGSGIGGNVVLCADAKSGAILWKSPTPYPAFGAPTVAGDRVLIGIGNGNFVMSDPNPAGAVVCLSLADGKELWKVATGDTVIGAVAVHGGRAYACSRDGNVHVIDVAKGASLAKHAVGAPMVCSPAVTAEAIYVTTDAGKLLCLDREKGAVRWSQALTPGSPVVSSPSVAAGRVFVGTRLKGLHCYSERADAADAKGPPRPWMGPGGTPGRTGEADDLGLPRIEGDTSDLKWSTAEALARPVTGPLSFSGWLLEVPFEGTTRSLVVAETGQVQPGSATGVAAADGAFAHDLVFRTAKESARLLCSDQVTGKPLWSVTLETPPVGLPTVAGGKIFVTTAGKDKAKSFLDARSIVDGSLVWKKELEAEPIGYPVASDEWVAVATADDRIAAFRTADGSLPPNPIMVGGKPVPPALVKDVLIVAGAERIAAYDLSAGEWLWNYKDQDNIGTATGQPVICNQTIWVGTTKKGLLAIGIPPSKEAPSK